MTETENDRLHTLKNQLPEHPKNDIVRSRGEYPGGAGADWSFGATAKPEADEHYGRQKSAGLCGEDKRQGDLRDLTGNLREPRRGEAPETQQSPHQAAQQGSDVRGIPPLVQGTNREDSLPEGLQRERKGPYDKDVGRKEEAARVPGNRKP
jgi:hypothetical protein